MALELAAQLPCVELKPLGDIPEIKLLGGAELQAFVDVAAGPPTDCKLTLNLLVQIAPLLASTACLFKILDVISKIKDFADGAKDLDIVKLGTAVPKLIDAITKLEGCIPALQIPRLVLMVSGILKLVIRFLSCFINQLESIIEFRASLDFAAADGNPVLKEALTCAQNSADAAQENLLKSIGPLKPVLDIVGMVGGLAGLSLELPDTASLSAGGDVTSTIASVKQAIDSLQNIADNLPG